jgi:tetratricopeptide (TPR) repeat protein
MQGKALAWYIAKKEQSMKAEFTTLVQKLIVEQGKEALFNTAKCKAFLADYTGSEYQNERRLLLNTVEAGITKAIADTKDLAACKQQAVQKLQDEYYLAPNIAAGAVNMLSVLLGKETQQQIIKNNAVADLPQPVLKSVCTGKKRTKRNILIVVGVVMVFFIGTILVLQTTPEKRSERLFSKAAILGFNDNFIGAIAKYTEGISIYQQNARAYADRGSTYLKINENDLAIQDFNKAIELGLQLAWVYEYRGDAYLIKNEYDLAIQDFNKSIESNHGGIIKSANPGRVYIQRGEAYRMKGEYGLAIQDFEKAISFDQNDQQARDRLTEAKQAQEW